MAMVYYYMKQESENQKCTRSV